MYYQKARISTRVAAGLLGTVVAVGLAPGQASAASAKSVVTVANAQAHGNPGKVKADVRFDLSGRWADRVRGVARSRANTTCDGCSAAGVAFQVLIGNEVSVDQSADAVAQCDDCAAVAENYAFVVQSAKPVELTGQQRAVLADVQKQLKKLDGSNMTAGEIQTHVRGLAARVESVLQGALRESERKHGHTGHVNVRHLGKRLNHQH